MFPNLRLLFQRVFIVVQEINYPPCFIVYYEIKQRKKRRISLFRRSHSKPSPSWANSTSLRSHGFVPLSILPRTTRKNFVGTTGESLYPVGGTGWYMDLVTNHSKPTSIGQKHSHCLANYSNSVVIGYSGRKLPWKLLTIVYKGKPLPGSPFVCSCWVPIRVHR